MRKAKAISVLFLVSMMVHAEQGDELKQELAPLQFLLGWCWFGEFPDGKQTDLHCYESVFNGAHLRDRHVVKGGSTVYQGETIYSWNTADKEISYVYWNSYGGVSTGTAAPNKNSIEFPDEFYTGGDGKTVTISSAWENISDDAYDSISVEKFTNGTKRERKVRYHRKPFTKMPTN